MQKGGEREANGRHKGVKREAKGRGNGGTKGGKRETQRET